MALQQTTDSDYMIVSNRELSSVLGYFSSDMVSDVIDDILQDRIRNHSPIIGNLVESYETNFKLAIDSYKDINRELLEKRYETYCMILTKICQFHSLEYELTERDDIYAAAYYTYQFLISNFQNNIITFFYNFINREKNSLYENLKLGELKKNKDSSSIYSKKVYKRGDSQLAVIHANLDFVLNQISGFDISLYDIIQIVYLGNPAVSNFLCNILKDCGDFYKTFIVPVIMGPDRPIIITNIRLMLQGDQQSEIGDFITGGNDE